MVIIDNWRLSLPSYEIGDRILQIQLKTREDVVFEITEELSNTDRGPQGFGNTGNKIITNENIL